MPTPQDVEVASRVVRYLADTGGLIGDVYNMLLDDGHVDPKVLGDVLGSCSTLEDRINFLTAILLQPPCDQQREWIEAFGQAWLWSGQICESHCDVQAA